MDSSINYCLKSDVGKVRKNNEDSIRTEVNLFDDHIFIVADGMGGHLAGDVASNIACTIIGDLFLNLSEVPNYSEFIKEAIEQANKEIYRRAILDPKCNKMGTTVSAIIYSKSLIYTGHIGDSRIYYMDKGGIRQLTNDHTLVRAMVEAGNMVKGGSKYNKFKNVLLQALGTNKKITVDVARYELPENYKLLICSDGLTGEVTDDDIYEYIYLSDNNLEDKVENIIQYAKEIDGSDNISVIVLENGSEQ